MSEPVSGPDIETLVYDALSDRTSDLAWLEEVSAHVAAVLRAHIVTAQADAWEVGHDSCGIRHSCDNPYRAALVGRVDPSLGDGGSTDLEVCQSADQTSTQIGGRP